MGLRVDVGGVLRDLLADERVQIGQRPVRLPGRATRFALELGEKRGKQGRTARPQKRLLDHALQLANVARPRVRPEPFQRLGCDLTDVAMQRPTEQQDIVSDELLEIRSSLAQWREVDREYTQPVV